MQSAVSASVMGMDKFSEEIQNFTPEQINELDTKGELTLVISGKSIILSLEDVEISSQDIPGWLVANANGITVALDITLTDELRNEGIARELVNRIQNIRKDSGFNLSDRIDVTVSENAVLQPSIIQYKAYICAEILADSLVFLPAINDGTEIEVNDVILKVNVLKKG